HPYSRQIAAYPGVQASKDTENSRDGSRPHTSEAMRIQSKYWPPVRRIEQAWGDRNLTAVWPRED
ncbi:hypothetical protein KW815_22400, partial [Enterobacter quasiroggenkampii]